MRGRRVRAIAAGCPRARALALAVVRLVRRPSRRSAISHLGPMHLATCALVCSSTEISMQNRAISQPARNVQWTHTATGLGHVRHVRSTRPRMITRDRRFVSASKYASGPMLVIMGSIMTLAMLLLQVGLYAGHRCSRPGSATAAMRRHQRVRRCLSQITFRLIEIAQHFLSAAPLHR